VLSDAQIGWISNASPPGGASTIGLASRTGVALGNRFGPPRRSPVARGQGSRPAEKRDHAGTGSASSASSAVCDRRSTACQTPSIEWAGSQLSISARFLARSPPDHSQILLPMGANAAEGVIRVTLVDVAQVHVACLQTAHDTVDIIPCSILRANRGGKMEPWERFGFASSESCERSKGSNLIIVRGTHLPDPAWRDSVVQMLQMLAWLDSIIVMEICSELQSWAFFEKRRICWSWRRRF
jgi:hypothetical protein